MKNPPVLDRIIRKAVDIVYPDIELVGLENLPAEPSIIVGNHSQAHGPIITEERLPFPHYTWCASQMMNKSEVADYAYTDFWSKKPKQIRWFYKLLSRIIPGLASYIMVHANTIPVYRDNRCITTFRMTVDKLRTGNSIVIFPECYEPCNNIIYRFQNRFIDVAKLYYRRTGECLHFVPMYLAPRLKKVIFGKPIRYNPDNRPEEERQRICDYLMETVTEIARSQPLHTVIPYPNIPKREYPQNIV